MFPPNVASWLVQSDSTKWFNCSDQNQLKPNQPDPILWCLIDWCPGPGTKEPSMLVSRHAESYLSNQSINDCQRMYPKSGKRGSSIVFLPMNFDCRCHYKLKSKFVNRPSTEIVVPEPFQKLSTYQKRNKPRTDCNKWWWQLKTDVKEFNRKKESRISESIHVLITGRLFSFWCSTKLDPLGCCFFFFSFFFKKENCDKFLVRPTKKTCEQNEFNDKGFRCWIEEEDAVCLNGVRDDCPSKNIFSSLWSDICWTKFSSPGVWWQITALK